MQKDQLYKDAVRTTATRVVERVLSEEEQDASLLEKCEVAKGQGSVKRDKAKGGGGFGSNSGMKKGAAAKGDVVAPKPGKVASESGPMTGAKARAMLDSFVATKE